MAKSVPECRAALERQLQEKTREAHQALERLQATSEILRVVKQSQTDTRPIFDSIIRSAVRLCDGTYGSMARVDGATLHLWAHYNYTREALELVSSRYPAPVSETSLVGLAVQTGETVHSQDMRNDPRVRWTPYTRALGLRAQISVPLLRDQRAIGTLNVLRTVPGPFTQRQIEILELFADQAVIAIENVRLFRELQEKTHQLEAASRHKSEFLASMSHELRTPLNAVIGFSEVLGERMFGELNEKQAEYVEDINISGRHLLSLINDILDLSKIEAGAMELDFERFPLAPALDNALTLVKQRAQRRGIALEARLAGDLGEMEADERKLKQILLNLLSNAVKFTGEGGRVTLEAIRDDTSVHLAVHDTGVGISSEDQELIFEEFRQVGTGRSGKVEGTGLGLTLTRRFVQMHGGEITVQSEPGVGSVFRVTLPLRASAPLT